MYLLFSKISHPFTKGSVGTCMQILSFLTIQHHVTAKDKNCIHVLQEHYTKQKEQHSIITQFQTVSVHCFLYILRVERSNALSKNYLYNSSLNDLVLRRSLVFHCSCINTASVGRDATGKRRPETISGLRKTKQMPQIMTKKK